MGRLHRTVVVLGAASLLTDLSSEMIYPLLPVFLTVTLGAGAISLGVVEGVAESTAAVLKVISGRWTDAVGRRTPFVFAGYGLAGFVRPLIGLATGWPFVLAMRFLDRVGKGIRTAPRDALIADVTPPEQRGTAFGYHRAMDHVGAILGPIVAATLIGVYGMPIGDVFLLAFIPAALVMAVLIVGLREPERTTVAPSPVLSRSGWWEMPPNMKRLYLAILVFALGNSTDAFILLRLSDAGVQAPQLALLWSVHHVVKSVASAWGGSRSDRVGRKPIMVVGWIVYAVIYAGLGVADSAPVTIALFIAYGVYFGLVEPVERAWIADLAPAHLRGTAIGYYHGVVGLAAFPASVLFGLIWQQLGPSAAFGTGAVLAIAASALLLGVRESRVE